MMTSVGVPGFSPYFSVYHTSSKFTRLSIFFPFSWWHFKVQKLSLSYLKSSLTFPAVVAPTFGSSYENFFLASLSHIAFQVLDLQICNAFVSDQTAKIHGLNILYWSHSLSPPGFLAICANVRPVFFLLAWPRICSCLPWSGFFSCRLFLVLFYCSQKDAWP